MVGDGVAPCCCTTQGATPRECGTTKGTTLWSHRDNFFVVPAIANVAPHWLHITLSAQGLHVIQLWYYINTPSTQSAYIRLRTSRCHSRSTRIHLSPHNVAPHLAPWLAGRMVPWTLPTTWMRWLRHVLCWPLGSRPGASKLHESNTP